MELNEQLFRQIFNRTDWERGEDYYYQNRVKDLRVSQKGRETVIESIVRGTLKYQVRIRAREPGSLFLYCNCHRYLEHGICKHLAATVIAYSHEYEEMEATTSDSCMQELLQTYLNKSKRAVVPVQGEVRLLPRISQMPVFSDQYPVLSFRLGRDKMYVLKSVKGFLTNVHEKNTISYGKTFSLTHTMEQFDPRSQELIRLLMDEFDEFHALTQRGYGSYNSWSYGRSDVHQNQIRLTGAAFDRWFDLFRDEKLEYTVDAPVQLLERDPKIRIKLQKKKNHAQLDVEEEEGCIFFGSAQSLYAAKGGQILRCSSAFREGVYPLLQRSRNKMRIAYSDLPTFCSCVLPEVEELVTVADPHGLLQEYLPEECTPCFYLDMEDGCLFLKLAFRYGDQEISWDTPTSQTASLRRNLPLEQQAVGVAQQHFRQEGGIYYIDNEDAVYEFLTGAIDELRPLGEIYLSDQLRSKRIQPSTVGVGISVSDGLLQLDLDTGGFPVEELSALYQSLLRRKKYHRLSDGRYLELNGSSVEKMAEMSKMLQLTPKDLEQGTVTLPAFRALYLDSLLSGSDGLHVTRDRQFRQMIRKFKAVEESDDVLMPQLDKVLRPYQKTGFRWLKTLESCGFGGILADEMGLGKTLQVISYLTTVPEQTVKMPNLVVCPTSLILNWGDELRRFAPHLSAALIMGNAAERKKLREEAEHRDVWVTSYELLRQDLKDYQSREFYSCILDEGQHIKNQSTLISKAVKQISCRQRFVLTGTPIENRLSELWNLFDFLMPGYLFSHTAFRDKLEKPIIKSQNPEAAIQLRRLVQPFILRRLKKDVLKELPPKIEHVRRVSLSELERKVYHASLQSVREGLGEGQGKLQILAALTQLRQICCDPSLCFENYTGDTAKLDACMELCESMVQNGHQILLFSQFTSMLDRLRQQLDQRQISSFTLQGSTPKEKRAQLVKAFNRGEASVFLISLKAGGTGLNLTAADVVIHYDPWWNLAAQEQATDRAHRIGQQSHVHVYKFIAKDTIEEKILDLQDKKAALMDTISGESTGGILEMSKEELLALLQEGC